MMNLSMATSPRYIPAMRYSLRGPKPVTAPHLSMSKFVRTIEPAKGEPKSNFHGIGVLGR